jgi:hypothetical protein
MADQNKNRNIDTILASARERLAHISVGGSWGFSECWDELLLAYEGMEIVACERIGHWEGDYIYLLRLQSLWGFYVGGYGSCSGCDPLEGLNEAEVNNNAQSLLDWITWCESAEGMISILRARDGENSWYYHEREWREVLLKFISILEPQIQT